MCKGWANDVAATIPCDVFLFGSAIYKGGDQFDAQLSDLDLIVLFNEELAATARVERLLLLRKHKKELELFMIPALHRTNCVDPGASLVPITALELQANIHKSGARSFFERNIFLNLKTEEQSISLPNAGIATLIDDNRQALEYSQKIRNQFLAVSGNGTGGLDNFDGLDPLPKTLARVAAQLAPNAEEGEWYDTRLGLEYLYAELARRRDESDRFKSLYRSMSVRRGGNGRRRPLSELDQLLLAEILYDLAAAARLEPVIMWEIRFNGGAPHGSERERILDGLRRLVPDGRILSVRNGSIIVRLHSSKRSYETVRQLNELNVLSKFFAVDEVRLSLPGHVHDFVGLDDASGPLDRIAKHIAGWRPQVTDNIKQIEADLGSWLNLWLKNEPSLADAIISREMSIGIGARPPRADFLLRFGTPDERESSFVIELFRLRNRSNFFQRLDYVLQFGLPTILVVVGSSGLLETLTADIERFENLNGQVRVVAVPLYNG